jgi:hypothetical protein
MASVSFLVLLLLAGMAASELRGLSPRVASPGPRARRRSKPAPWSPSLSLCASCP